MHLSLPHLMQHLCLTSVSPPPLLNSSSHFNNPCYVYSPPPNPSELSICYFILSSILLVAFGTSLLLCLHHLEEFTFGCFGGRSRLAQTQSLVII